MLAAAYFTSAVERDTVTSMPQEERVNFHDGGIEDSLQRRMMDGWDGMGWDGKDWVFHEMGW